MPGAHSGTWTAVRPDAAETLVETRLQVHHAAQFATAAGISYLAARPDDSHTNLEWIPAEHALVSNVIAARSTFRVGVRVADLALVITDGAAAVRAAYPLHGRTIADATAWLRTQVTAAGADPTRYTLKRHYEIPSHAVEGGRRFDASNTPALAQVSAWFGNGASVLASVAGVNPGSSAVRCWPHHFDIASLLTLDASRSIGFGLEPGDNYYAEPYFYVNLSPAPAEGTTLGMLAGGGSWHTREWIGAVLPGSRLAAGGADQERQARAFLESAVAACRTLLGG